MIDLDGFLKREHRRALPSNTIFCLFRSKVKIGHYPIHAIYRSIQIKIKKQINLGRSKIKEKNQDQNIKTDLFRS